MFTIFCSNTVFISGENPQNSHISHAKERCGQLMDKFRNKVGIPQGVFDVEVLHGDFLEGKRHSLEISSTEEGRLNACFQMATEVHPSGEILTPRSSQFGVRDIARLELTSEKVGFHPFAHSNWKRGLIPAGVSLGTLFTKFDWRVEVAATLVSAVLSTSLGKKVRFVCDTKDGRHFCALMPAVGYHAVEALFQDPNWQPAPQLRHFLIKGPSEGAK